MRPTAPLGRPRIWPLALALLIPPLFLFPIDDGLKAGGILPEPAAAPLSLADWPLTETETLGRKVYETWCIGCHGQEGRGDGIASTSLSPLPRDFQSGLFKFRSTESGKLPLIDDLMRTITCGLPGSSMPGFPLVPESERRAVARYVLSLSVFRRAAIELSIRPGDVAEKKTALTRSMIEELSPVAVTPSPKVTPELLQIGKGRYDNECKHCHGLTGRGDGSSSSTLRDYKDGEIRARDFTSGVFRSGSKPNDLFIRLKTGLNGTPMPSIAGTDQELWGLVHYMLSLKDPSAPKPKFPPGCSSGEEEAK